MSISNNPRRPHSNTKAKQKSHPEDYDSESNTSLSNFSVTAIRSGQSYRPQGWSSSSVATASHGSSLSDKVSDEVDKTSTYSSSGSDYGCNNFDVSSVLGRTSSFSPSLASDGGTRLSAKVTRQVEETSRRSSSTLGSGLTIGPTARALSSLQGVRSRPSSSEPTNRINGISRHRSFNGVVDTVVRSQPGYNSRHQASTRNWNSRTDHFTRPR